MYIVRNIFLIYNNILAAIRSYLQTLHFPHKTKKEFTFVKNVNTRFGRPQTTGIAVIYGDAESAKVEPEFIHNRHTAIHSPAAPEPVADESSSDEEEAESEEGGDE